MKKLGFLLVTLVMFISLVGCGGIREYKGSKISSLTIETIKYLGGITTEYIIDFENNNVKKVMKNPEVLEENENEVIARFTEDQEKLLVNKCYTYGLFNLKEEYIATKPIADGAGWSITINYANGKSKKSIGQNAIPVTVFSKCAMAFYDICNDGIIYHVSEEYYLPPEISVSFGYESDNFHYSSNTLSEIKLTNYKWINFDKTSVDLYLLNNSINKNPIFLKGYNYKLTLYTANYNYSKKFYKLELFSYDYNENLSNEKLILLDGWIKQKTVNLELDKIYVLKLSFRNGDFAEYTFNTKSVNSKLLFGKYQYNIYRKGFSSLKINEDNTFELDKFKYFSNEYQELDKLTGTYTFEIIDGKEYLCLYANESEKIVFSYDAIRLILDVDKTNFNIMQYIELDNEELIYYTYNGK